MEEVLGIGFGVGVTIVSILLAYQLFIKPEKESRQREFWRSVEEMHRRKRQHANRNSKD